MFERKVNYISKGYRKNYNICMKSYTINMDTGVDSVSELKSNYFREIYDVPGLNVGFAKYTLTDTFYSPRQDCELKKWTFARDAEFYNTLFWLPDEEIKNAYYKEAHESPPYLTLTESFSRYPKLPSVYLLVMQAIDVITFDAFSCMVNSSFPKASFSTEFQKVKELANRNIGIGTGIYSDSSYYWNNNLYIRFVGRGVYENEECWIVDFDSAPSDIYMEHIKSKQSKKSKSLYSGSIYLSVSTGEILYGELDEDVVTIDKIHKYTKRKVILCGS